MNENPNTTGGGNIDDILEIIKKRREEGVTPSGVSNDAPTRLDNTVVKPISDTKKEEVQESLFGSPEKKENVTEASATESVTESTEKLEKAETAPIKEAACVSASSTEPSASAFESSVLPTPVGPRKMKEPIGLFGSLRPTLPLRIARDTALTASC